MTPDVGGDGPPTNASPCECEFEYAYRWPQFYELIFSGDPADMRRVTALLAERDRSLEDHFSHRCCNGTVACLFEYPVRWPQIATDFFSSDPRRVMNTVALLDENDRALERHLKDRPCFGTNYAVGITCEFDYPYRWPEVYVPFFSNDDRQLRAAVAVLEERDRALELHLKLRICHPASAF